MTTAAPVVEVPAPSPALDDVLTAGPEDEAPASPPADATRRLLPWLGHVGCFVGAGLVSGGIVHHPLDPTRYTAIAAAGVLLFLAATFVNEVLLTDEKPDRARLLRVLGASLLLALGIGMLSGGIQHFSDLGQRAAVLVPAGLVLSFVAYALRSGWGLKATLLSRLSGALVVVAAGGYVGLGMLAGDAPAGHAHGEGHATPAVEAAHTDPAHSDPAHAEAAHADPAHPDAAHAPVAPHTDGAHAAVPGAPVTEHAPAAVTPQAPVDLQAELARLVQLQKQLAELKAK